MVRFFPGAQRTPLLFSCLVALFCAGLFSSGTLRAADATTAKAPVVPAGTTTTEIRAVEATETGSGLEIRVKGSKPLISTVYELPNPSRIIVDVAEAKLAEGFTPRLPENKKVTLTTSEVADAKPPITRLEFTLDSPAPYTSAQDGNDMVLAITARTAPPAAPPKEPTAVAPSEQDADKPATKDQVGSLINQKKNIDSQLPKINPLAENGSSQDPNRSAQDAFNFSGYNKERITVEFQKMDLHNVFNFIRQISGANIVVDEDVKGSLTLVLDDVPWDFALDIILNLKELEKEERFNTLVIFPKGKKYIWPEKSQNKLSFEPARELLEKNTLVIQQEESQSLETIEAKNLINKGKELEKKEDYENSIKLYEQALEKWPDNEKLANRISSLYLIKLRENNKALHFAKKSLQIEPNNQDALLNAGIASANLRENDNARSYFREGIQTDNPSKELLLSFAVFSEETKDFKTALGVLDQHNKIYGDDLNSLIARARIYDKKGDKVEADRLYKKILLSGSNVPNDLRKYINSRFSPSQIHNR